MNQKGSDIMKIVNKIITFLAAVAVFPVLIKQTFFSVILSIDKESSVYTLANTFLGSDNQLTGNRLGVEKSLLEIFDYLTGKTPSTFDWREILANLPAEFLPLKKYVIASLIFVAIGAFITIIVMGCTLFTKAYKTVIGLSLGSAASFLTAIILFGKAAKPFMDGTIDITSTILSKFVDSESFFGSIVVGLLNGAVSVDACGLGGAVYGAMIIMFGIAIWEFAYYITLPKEEKPVKKVKA